MKTEKASFPVQSAARGTEGRGGGGAHHGAKARKDGGRRRCRIIETIEHDGYDGTPRRSPLPKPASLIAAPSPGYSAPLGASHCASQRPGVFLACIQTVDETVARSAL